MAKVGQWLVSWLQKIVAKERTGSGNGLGDGKEIRERQETGMDFRFLAEMLVELMILNKKWICKKTKGGKFVVDF